MFCTVAERSAFEVPDADDSKGDGDADRAVSKTFLRVMTTWTPPTRQVGLGSNRERIEERHLVKMVVNSFVTVCVFPTQLF